MTQFKGDDYYVNKKKEVYEMKKALAFGLALFLSFLTVNLVKAGNVSPPSVVVIDNKGYTRDKKGPVKFSHEKHVKQYKVACTECHHVYKDGKNVWKEGDPVQKCIECHSPKKVKGQLDLKRAYHKNCMGCHKKLAKEGKISVKEAKRLRKCSTCHVKKM